MLEDEFIRDVTNLLATKALYAELKAEVVEKVEELPEFTDKSSARSELSNGDIRLAVAPAHGDINVADISNNEASFIVR